jgi:hypothetical protein
LLSQAAEEGLDVTGEEFGRFHRGEITALRATGGR